jgi:hypothetical protein
MEPLESPATPARAHTPTQDRNEAGHDPAWHLSSWDLRSGLTVIEFDDADTVPGDLT